jgi:hypothetical protein
VTFCRLLDMLTMPSFLSVSDFGHAAVAWTSDGVSAGWVRQAGYYWAREEEARPKEIKDRGENGRNQVNRKERLWQV